jgi:hypothetical protein
MNEKLVTIATYSDQIAANLARLKLDSEGIECFLLNENTVSAYSGLVGMMKIQLQVKESDADKAIEALNAKLSESELQQLEDEASAEESPDEEQR